VVEFQLWLKCRLHTKILAASTTMPRSKMKIQNKKIPAAENWTALQAAFVSLIFAL
jgi:hypothetical protein